MKKVVSTNFYGEGNPNNHVSFMGCLETIKWKALSYCGEPKKSGRYLTADGRGKVKVLHFADRDDTKDLVVAMLRGGYRYSLVTDDYDSGCGALTTDEDLLNVIRSNKGVWYDICDEYEYGECAGVSITLFFNEGATPKYFLDDNLDDPATMFGPIDEMLDTYENEEVADCKRW